MRKVVKWVLSGLTLLSTCILVGLLAQVMTLGIESNDLRIVMLILLGALGGGFISAPLTLLAYGKLEDWEEAE